MKTLKTLLLIGLIFLFISSTVFAQQTGSLSGQVSDINGAILPGATVTIFDTAGKEVKNTLSNKDGNFAINGLAPGKYTVKAIAPKFSLYESSELEIKGGQKEELIIALSIAAVTTDVQVDTTTGVSTDPNDNKDANILSGDKLKDLPDDPDELQAYLQALAGPGAGPDGAQFNIDGFSGGRLPPKEAIREIRINSNPFSAEFDRVGFGRVDILTKPGFDKMRGSVDGRFNDESLNSRNPFSLNRAPSQTRSFGGYLSGPIKAKKSSYFIDVNQSQNDNSNVISATILDASNNIVAYNQDVRVPSRRLSISPRIDYQINDSNTLVARYSFTRSTAENQGVGSFALASRAYDSSNVGHEVRITESAILNPKTVNETRFSYEFNKRVQDGGTLTPSINVSSAFTGGGAQVGNSYNTSNRWEVQNYTTTTFGNNSQHGIKFGVRVRGVSIEDRSESGYGGSFTFAGVRGAGGVILFSSIEQFRQKVLGNSSTQFNPTQFSLTTGNPVAKVSQIDYSFFGTDDWKARKDLTVSLGLRYENQTNLSSNLNFAPRIGFAYAPGAGGAKQPKTTIRGAFGVFYDRFSENTTLTARRNDGVSQVQYIVTDPTLLGQAVFTRNGVTNVPTAAQLASFAPLSNTPRRIDSTLESPYSVQSAFSVDQTLPMRSTLSVTFVVSRTLHSIRLRNINAPVCPTIQVCPAGLTQSQVQLLRPNPTAGNIYEYESNGVSNSQALRVGFNTRLTNKINIFSNYSLSFQKGNVDGGGFPAYSYDFTGEYAPSSFVARHTVFIGGSASLPFGFRLSPTIIISSGRRFNITSGIDANYDSQFNERPTYAALFAACTKLNLTNPFCNTSGITNVNDVIPRNYGIGPGSFNMNANLSKTISFGGSKSTTADNKQGGGRNGGGGGGNRGGGGGGQMVMMGGGGGMMGMFGGGGDANKKYSLTFGMNATNILNHVNKSNPTSSISSPTFGQSISNSGGGFGFFGGGGGGGGGSSSANRKIDLSLRFSW